MYRLPGSPGCAPAIPFPPSSKILPGKICPSDNIATLPPPPAPPAFLRYRTPGSLESAPAASPPRTSSEPRFSIDEAINLIAPPDPAPPE